MGRSPFSRTAQPPVMSKRASERALNYCRDLMLDKAICMGQDRQEAEKRIVAWFGQSIRSSDEISANITRLKDEGYTGKKHLAVGPPAPKPLDPEEGMYVVGETVYKVYRTVHGANQLVAKELILDFPDCGGCANGEPCGAGCTPTGEFEYRGKAPLAKITSQGRRLTIEEAQAYGKLYGQCCMCLAPLTNELSIHLGIGPVCGGREFGGTFKMMLKEAKLELPRNPALDADPFGVRTPGLVG